MSSFKLLLVLGFLAAAPSSAAPSAQDQALVEAIRRGDTPEVSRLIPLVDPSFVDHRGKGWLHLLAEQTFSVERLYSALIARGADVNAQDHDGETPLLTLLSSNARLRPDVPAAMKLLIAKGADVNKRSSNESPLERVLHRQDDKVLEELLAAGKPNLAALDPFGHTVGEVFVMMGCGNPSFDARRVELLVAAGADFGKAGANGRTALQMAEKNHCKPLVPKMRAAR